MNAISRLFAVRPTGTVGHATLDPIDLAAGLPAGYTNITPVQTDDTQYLCAYNATTGAADLYLVADADPWLTLVESRIDLTSGPWEKLTTFTLGNELYLLTYRAEDGMFGFYHLSKDLSTSPPYLFYFSRNTPTIGFTEIAAVSSLGSQYVLGYNFSDGTVAAFSVNVTTSSSGGVPPLVALNVWYHHWAKDWTHFAFFQLGGANFFFKINTGKLNVNIDHLNDNPALGTVEVGSFLMPQLPDALAITNAAIIPWAHGDPYLITYIASSGATAILRIHGDCLGWTKQAERTIIAGASLVVPYAAGKTSYVLFYGAAV
jgi:hypothetical protein